MQIALIALLIVEVASNLDGTLLLCRLIIATSRFSGLQRDFVAGFDDHLGDYFQILATQQL